MPIKVAKKQGWRILAGGFTERELDLAEEIMQFIEKAGGRVAFVAGTTNYNYVLTDTVEIWRPSSEMEYIYETEHRLRRERLSSVKGQ